MTTCTQYSASLQVLGQFRIWNAAKHDRTFISRLWWAFFRSQKWRYYLKNYNRIWKWPKILHWPHLQRAHTYAAETVNTCFPFLLLVAHKLQQIEVINFHKTSKSIQTHLSLCRLDWCVSFSICVPCNSRNSSRCLDQIWRNGIFWLKIECYRKWIWLDHGNCYYDNFPRKAC